MNFPWSEPTFFEAAGDFLHRCGPIQTALTYFLYMATALGGVWALLGLKFLFFA